MRRYSVSIGGLPRRVKGKSLSLTPGTTFSREEEACASLADREEADAVRVGNKYHHHLRSLRVPASVAQPTLRVNPQCRAWMQTPRQNFYLLPFAGALKLAGDIILNS